MRKALMLGWSVFSLLLFLFVPQVPGAGPPETLFGVAMDPRAGTFSMDVLSNGCTRKQSFEFDLRGEELTIRRTEPDACKMAPHRVTVTYGSQDVQVLRGRTFKVMNPISYTTGWENR